MPDQPPRRPRRLLRSAVVLAALLAAVAWFAPLIVAKTGLRQRVIDKALADLNGRATADAAALGWFAPVVLTGVRVTDPAGAEVATAESVRTSLTLLQLARAVGDYGTVTVTRPVVHLACRPGGTNVEDLIRNYTAASDTPPGPTRTAVKVDVTDGKLVQTEAGVPGDTALDPVAVSVTVPADRAEPVSVDVTATCGGTAAIDMAFGSPLSGKLNADRFPLEAAGPILRRFGVTVRVGGSLTADLSGEFGDAPSLRGRAGVRGLTLGAPWLGPDPVRLASAELPLDIAVAGDEIDVRKAELTCDVGTLRLTGKAPLAGTAEQYAGRAGLTAAADLDVARLSGLAPRLLRLRPGTALTDGRLVASLTSAAAADGTRWTGAVGATAVKGTRDGKAIAWEQPLRADFTGKLGADGRPAFDKLEVRCEFAAVAAAGTADKFQLAANLDLDKLAARLAEFADLGGAKLAGTATVQATGERGSGGRFAVAVRSQLTNFAVAAAGLELAEPAATVEVRASGSKPTGRPIQLSVAEVGVTAATDTLTAKLLEPLPDALTPTAGKATVTVGGDLGRWRRRLAAVTAIPADWVVAGSGTANATVAFSPAGADVAPLDVALKPVRFRGAGLDLDEPQLVGKAGTVTWRRAGNPVAVTDLNASCPSLTVGSPSLAVAPTPAGTVNVAGDLARLTAPLKLSSPVAGIVRGPVTLTATGFAADVRVEPFVYGPPGKPVWQEKWLKLGVAGEWATDAVKFSRLAVERDGTTAQAAGTVVNLSGTPTVDLAGTVRYDFARLEPQLRQFLGAGAVVRGRGDKPFRLRGPVGGAVDQLAGDATVGWEAVKAYGFDMGPGELKAALGKGRLNLSPVQAAFGGGTVRLDPAIDLTQPDYPLTLAKGTVVERARLSPQVMAGAVGYALPAVFRAAQADGTASFELEGNRIPLTDPNATELHGRLVLHDATLTAGPVFAQVLTLLEAKTTRVTMAKDHTVPVAVSKGRVYHENFALTFGQTVVRTKGSVGLADQSLDMELEMPIPPRAIDGPLRNNPRILEALKRQTIRVPVRGTLSRPDLEERTILAAAAGVVRAAARDAGGKVVDDLFKRGLGELQKRLEPKAP
jgi:hypothetical protein